MSARRQTAAHAGYTASVIRRMAARNNVTASASENDLFAHHITRLAGDDVLLDDVEQMVIALQRAGVLSRVSGAIASAVSARKQAMTFDPFGDFATRGYLRNLAKAKDPDIVRRLQHNSFMTGLDEAVQWWSGKCRACVAPLQRVD